MNNKQIIFTPGPQKSVGILDKEEAEFHRSEEMMRLIAELKVEMQEYFGKKNAYIFPISGTDTMDVFIRSVDAAKQGQASLINTGYWAQNIAHILEGNDIKVTTYQRDIFDKTEAELIEIFSKDASTFFYAIASETSTGEFFNYKNIYQALKKTNKFLFMDAISLPVFAFDNEEKYNFDSDFIIFSSAKTFHALPGFNFILTNIDFSDKNLFTNKTYSSLKLYDTFAKKHQFPNTINTLVFKDFKTSFEYTINNIDFIKNKIKELRDHLTTNLVGKDFIYLNQEHDKVTNLVVLKFPTWLDSETFTKLAEEHKIYVGRDLMQQNTIRVCFNSYNTIAEVDALIALLTDFKNQAQR